MKLSIRDKMIGLRRLVRRLAFDDAGNVLMILAAAIIPLAGLVGSGLDMSRAYMAQSRLQQACDAAALAGRRVMVASTVDNSVRTEALKFFKFNFPTGGGGPTPPFGVAAFTPTIPDGTDGTVRISASTTVPTSLMAIFGYRSIPISATCFARQDFVNTDIVLVLDTTGSMSQDVNNVEQNSGPTSKIVALRAAVLALYDELAPVQTQLNAAGLRLRYGVVPYSIGVNVGDAIRSVDSNYLVSTWNYQSRVATFDVPSYVYTPTVGATSAPYWQTYSGGSISQSDCLKFMKNQNPYTTATTSGGPAPTAVTTYGFPHDGVATSGGTNGEWGWTGAPDTTTSNRSCRRLVTDTVTAYATSIAGYTVKKNASGNVIWTYRQAQYDVSNFKAGNPITLATNTSGMMPTLSNDITTQQMATSGSGFSTADYSWNGCIEERDTDYSINTSTTSVPSGAHDLNLDEIPSNDNTRWRPAWSSVIYTRNSSSSANPTADSTSGSAIASGNNSACPAAARRLQAWTRSDLSTYLAGLTASGYTYHDLGMIWGGRFISPTSIFSADNPTTYNSMPVARYIIYMTDGQLNTIENGYSTYGVEYLDKRITNGFTTSADQDNRHNQRFALACSAAKEKGVSIWVVAFASSLSTQLQSCASKSSQASVSTDSAALIAKFAEIGKNIGSLRLTQ